MKKYHIDACIYGGIVEEFETDSLKEARQWWRANWKKAEDYGGAFCEWYVNGRYQSIEQIMRLEAE